MIPPRNRSLAFGLALVALAALAAGIWVSCASRGGGAAAGRRVVVLGFDGMDHRLAGEMMAAGRLPNLARLAERGGFAPLETSVPPQSPVAWSNFITGLDAGGHGIFDFIHRDPATMEPYLSTSKAVEAERTLTLGEHKIPLEGGDVLLLRDGEAFWEVLEERGIETTILRMPANFPTSGHAHRELSGMGTPDLTGSPGTFSFFTTDLFAFYGADIGGGEVYEIFVEDGVAEASFEGPENPFKVAKERAEAPFSIYVDPDRPLAKVVVGDEEVLLAKGEWSRWVPIDFEFVPTQGVRGMVRFYLKSVRPELELYATPINFDPLDPAAPISNPAGWAGELARASGRFYTQGMPEDTRAFDEGIFTRPEFLAQARIAGGEVERQYRHVLDEFEDGLLFSYFGNLDQVSHMSWRPTDPGHPAFDPGEDPPYEEVIARIYERFDEVVGYTMERLGEDDLLVVMSDHGFSTWRRAVSLNTWLYENGYLAVLDPARMASDPGVFSNVDWSKTRAYALGLNGLYVNLRGRERDGIVAPADRRALMAEIGEKLLATVDPDTGERAVTRVYEREEVYTDRGHIELGPDLVVGYAGGYRSSDRSAMGGVLPEVFTDNTRAWSGDHCMDHTVVPGVLFTSRPLTRPAPSLKSLGAALVAEFGVEEFPRPPAG